MKSVLLASSIASLALLIACSGGSGSNGTTGTNDGGASSSGSSSSSGASGSSGTSGTPDTDGGSSSGTVVTAALTCVGIFDCATKCADGDSGCEDGCVAKGSDDAKSTVTAVVSCYTTNACDGKPSTCLSDNCPTELNACIEQDAKAATTGTPSTTAPTGTFPETLVGTWSRIGLSDGNRFIFEAGGATTVLFSSELTFGGCTSKLTASSSGKSVVDADKLLFHRELGTQTNKDCSGEEKAKPLQPADFTYTYVLGKNASGEDELTLTSDGSSIVLRRL